MTDSQDATSMKTAAGAPDQGAARAPRSGKPDKPGKPGKPPATKKAQLIRLLQRKDGADVAAISRRLSWQAHTTRAALTGAAQGRLSDRRGAARRRQAVAVPDRRRSGGGCRLMPRDDAIAARWTILCQLDRAALRVAWAQAFGAAPPHFLSMAFMRKALIWHEQGQKFGGLGPDLRRALNAAVKGTAPAHAASAAPRPGTQLIREWNGRRYIVEVTREGYLLNGARFRSLSAVALHITGTTWSGPRFFGLTRRARAVP